MYKFKSKVCEKCLQDFIPTAGNQKWCKDCMPTMKERVFNWKINHKERMKIYNKTWCIKHLGEYRLKLKIEVFTHYSNGTPKCTCCGETEIKFLSIDHINGGGGKHIRKIKRFGSSFYQWLKQYNYPSGYQVLCMNCNFAKGHFGECPHKQH